MMIREMTRSRLIQIWFAAIALFVVAGVVLGAVITVETGVLLLALALVPPAITLMLWPGVQPVTAAEVLHDQQRRD